MSTEQRNILMYVVMCVFEYAQRQGLGVQDAAHSLLSSGAISFLETHYAVEHTLPLDDTMDALATMCIRNGEASA